MEVGQSCDCSGHRLVTEQHSENGAIVPLCTSHGQDAGHVQIQNLVIPVPPTVRDAAINKQEDVAKRRAEKENLAVAAFASKGGQIFTPSSIGLTEATQAHTQLPSPREAGSNSQVTFERSDIWLRDNWPNSWLMFKCCCRAWTLGTFSVPRGATNSTNPNFCPLGFGSHCCRCYCRCVGYLLSHNQNTVSQILDSGS